MHSALEGSRRTCNIRNYNLVPRSLVDEAEGEIWPNPIYITWSPVRNVTGEASAHAQHKFGAVTADLHGTILSRTTSLRQAYAMTEEYLLESLNFVAFTKPSKHKMRLKGLFYNLAGFVFEYFCENFSDCCKVLSQFVFRNMIHTYILY